MSYKFTLPAFLSFMLASTSALALTCANDYGGNKSCASNATAAGDCETLGYSSEDVTDCQHYLYCPFNLNYKRCASLQEQEQPGFCSTGELNPTCKDGFAPFQIGTASNNEMCLECQPATCQAYNSSYQTENEYFTGSSFPLYKKQSVQLVVSPTEKQYKLCYTSCNSSMKLKTISSSNCAIGDVLLWMRNDDKFYCTSSTSSSSSSCAYFERLGVIAYISGSKIWAVKTTGYTSFSSGDTWPVGKKCHNLYSSAKKSSDYSYNSKVLLGQVSTSFASAGCSLSGGYIGSTYLNTAAGSFSYGFPDKTLLTNIAKNFTKVNQTLKAIGMGEIPMGYGCSERLVWFDSGFTVNYNGSGPSYDLIYLYQGMMSSGGFMECGTPKRTTDKAYGIMVIDANSL